MEGLTDILSKKIAALGEHIKQLKTDNVGLSEENAHLRVRIQELERALEIDSERVEHINQERSSVKAAIDELVENIDILISENR